MMTRRAVLLRATAAGLLLAASLLAHAQDCVNSVRSVPSPLFPGVRAAATLDAQARASANPVLEREIAVDGDGEDPLQGQVKVDAAGRRNRAGFVQVTLLAVINA